MEYAHTNLKPVNWTPPKDIKTAAAFVVRNHIHYGDVEPSPSQDLYPSWYVGGGLNIFGRSPVDRFEVSVGIFHPASGQRFGQVFHRGIKVDVPGMVTDPADNGIFSRPAGHQTVEAVVGGTGFDTEIPTVEALELVTAAGQAGTG